MTVSTRRLVDPQLLGLLDTMPYVELNPETLAPMRAAPMVSPVRPEDVDRATMARHVAPGPEGASEVLVIVYPTATAARPWPRRWVIADQAVETNCSRLQHFSAPSLLRRPRTVLGPPAHRHFERTKP